LLAMVSVIVVTVGRVRDTTRGRNTYQRATTMAATIASRRTIHIPSHFVVMP
jgi:hypothetical protein